MAAEPQFIQDTHWGEHLLTWWRQLLRCFSHYKCCARNSPFPHSPHSTNTSLLYAVTFERCFTLYWVTKCWMEEQIKAEWRIQRKEINKFILTILIPNNKHEANSYKFDNIRQVSQVAACAQRMAGFRGSSQDDRWLQRDGSTSWTDGKQSHESTTLEAHARLDWSFFWRRRRELLVEEHSRGTASEVQGGNWGQLLSSAKLCRNFRGLI